MVSDVISARYGAGQPQLTAGSPARITASLAIGYKPVWRDQANTRDIIVRASS